MDSDQQWATPKSFIIILRTLVSRDSMTKAFLLKIVFIPSHDPILRTKWANSLVYNGYCPNIMGIINSLDGFENNQWSPISAIVTNSLGKVSLMASPSLTFSYKWVKKNLSKDDLNWNRTKRGQNRYIKFHTYFTIFFNKIMEKI